MKNNPDLDIWNSDMISDSMQELHARISEVLSVAWSKLPSCVPDYKEFIIPFDDSEIIVNFTDPDNEESPGKVPAFKAVEIPFRAFINCIEDDVIDIEKYEAIEKKLIQPVITYVSKSFEKDKNPYWRIYIEYGEDISSSVKIYAIFNSGVVSEKELKYAPSKFENFIFSTLPMPEDEIIEESGLINVFSQNTDSTFKYFNDTHPGYNTVSITYTEFSSRILPSLREVVPGLRILFKKSGKLLQVGSCFYANIESIEQTIHELTENSTVERQIMTFPIGVISVAGLYRLDLFRGRTDEEKEKILKESITDQIRDKLMNFAQTKIHPSILNDFMILSILTPDKSSIKILFQYLTPVTIPPKVTNDTEVSEDIVNKTTGTIAGNKRTIFTGTILATVNNVPSYNDLLSLTKSEHFIMTLNKMIEKINEMGYVAAPFNSLAREYITINKGEYKLHTKIIQLNDYLGGLSYYSKIDETTGKFVYSLNYICVYATDKTNTGKLVAFPIVKAISPNTKPIKHFEEINTESNIPGLSFERFGRRVKNQEIATEDLGWFSSIFGGVDDDLGLTCNPAVIKPNKYTQFFDMDNIGGYKEILNNYDDICNGVIRYLSIKTGWTKIVKELRDHTAAKTDGEKIQYWSPVSADKFREIVNRSNNFKTIKTTNLRDGYISGRYVDSKTSVNLIEFYKYTAVNCGGKFIAIVAWVKVFADGENPNKRHPAMPIAVYLLMYDNLSTFAMPMIALYHKRKDYVGTPNHAVPKNFKTNLLLLPDKIGKYYPVQNSVRTNTVNGIEILPMDDNVIPLEKLTFSNIVKSIGE